MACPGGCPGSIIPANSNQNNFVKRGPKVNGNSANSLAGALASKKKPKKKSFFELRTGR